jgi:predicted dehydrogenase
VTDIKFAVVGTGLMAARMMSTFAKAGVRVTAVASSDPERARRFARAFAVPPGESDLDSILGRSDVDAVYIANASKDHAATCIAALEAGKAVLCEKPIALSEAEAHEVAQAARKTQILCMEGLWTLFLPAYKRFLEFSLTGGWGQANSLIADFGYPVSEETQQPMYAKDREGVLLDRGIYLIGLALSVFGPVERIDAQVNFTSFGVDKDVFLQLRHRSGGYSQLAASFSSLMSNTATLCCSRGLIQLEAPLIGSEVVSTRHAAVAPPSRDVAQPLSFHEKIIGKLRESPQLRRINQTFQKSVSQHIPFGADQYLPELNHFIALLRTGAQESDILPLEFSLNIHRIINEARAGRERPAFAIRDSCP